MNLEELKQLNTEEKEVEIIKYKTKVEQLSNLFAQLTVPYNDLNVLLEDTEELKLVNNFIISICCRKYRNSNLTFGSNRILFSKNC